MKNQVHVVIRRGRGLDKSGVYSLEILDVPALLSI